MEEHNFDAVKKAIVDCVRELFEEREHEIVVSHQEKLALLEDVLDNAVDVAELRVAFEQWHAEHADDVDFEDSPAQLWDQALAEYIEV